VQAEEKCGKMTGGGAEKGGQGGKLVKPLRALRNSMFNLANYTNIRISPAHIYSCICNCPQVCYNIFNILKLY